MSATSTHANAALIERFYTAFTQLDAETMASCYHPDVRFSDPAFIDLQGQQASDMWRMLCARAADFSLEFKVLDADAQQGSAQWVARYQFSKTGNQVVNRIAAEFRFKDGLIIEHRDRFNLWRWSAQALGIKGLLLGWLPPVQKAISAQAMVGLKQWQAQQGRG
ncbi:nuclear transport factor 2 family protein [Atopomonas sediminilitoris]|uniref:nuclear transport factor 2 family protein n=1 Tax=Atopomonas sediminilitoris TaxID=2919919 RepID=UPI001F4E5FDE|nr:nuclear transport factor 2 family protein [Atopomonas sediminilitoris]MCJ8169944.1 nuclear transport factor 2 family protein [Atopomonas sediminilitoris]